MAPRVRQITSSHIAEIIHIAGLTNLSAWSAQNYLDELRTEASIMLALEDELAKTLGFIVGRVVPSAEYVGLDAEIYNIAVIPAQQGRGRGQRLFDGFMGECSKHGVARVWLEVRASNVTAIRFYTRNGFEPVQTRRNFYKEPLEDGVLMRLSIDRQTP